MKHEKLRYQPNKVSQLLTLIGMVFMVLALFKVINVYRYHDTRKAGRIIADMWVGLEILVGIFVMLLSFLASEKMKNYDKKWLWVSLGLAGYSFIKIFLYPLSLNKLFSTMIANGEPLKFNPKTWLFTVLIYLIISTTLHALSTYIGFIKTNQLDQYYKELNSSDGN